jgi:YD repeat-containing protein
MYIKPAAAIATLFILQPLILTADELLRRISNQSDTTITNKISSGEKSPMSDREKAGLRGPVQQCTEERTTPAFENFPGTSYVTISKYSPDGKLLQTSIGNSVESAQESSVTYTYDSAGRLLKKTTTNAASPVSESNYQYDQKGRIISITGDPIGTSTFEYDDNGRKTRIVSTPSTPLVPEGTQYMFPMPETEDPYLPIPTGGHVKISYNEQDQPVEWQVSDSNGNLVNRLIRTYAENGRLTELRYTIESHQYLLPAEVQQELMAEPGALEEMLPQLTKLLGEQRNFTRMTYTYDADGRLIEQHHYIGHSMESTTKIVYNDHSDKLEERQFTTGDPNPPKDTQSKEASPGPPFPPQESQVRYSYKYDTFGNWTEQTTPSSASPNYVSVIRRIIVYYSAGDESDRRATHPSGFLQRVSAFFRPI